MTIEQQSCQNIDCAIREYFWYGREIFEVKRKELLKLAFKHNLQFYMRDSFAPSWEQLCKQFRESSLKLVPDWSVESDQE